MHIEDGGDNPALFLVANLDALMKVPCSAQQSTTENKSPEPPVQATKVLRQPTITQFSKSSSWSLKPPRQPYSAARARNIKLYSEREIHEANGVTKLYGAFWNKKAEDICSSPALNHFKKDTWSDQCCVDQCSVDQCCVEKAAHIKNEAMELEVDVGPKCPDYLIQKFKASKKTIDRNTKRMEESKRCLKQTQERLVNARHELFNSTNKTERTAALVKIEQIEKYLESQLTELRKSQDALRKSVDNKRKLLRTLDKEKQCDDGENMDEQVEVTHDSECSGAEYSCTSDSNEYECNECW